MFDDKTDTAALQFEGESELVLSAAARDEPLLTVIPGNGIGSSATTGFALGLEILGLRQGVREETIVSSSGALNGTMHLFGLARELTPSYLTDFCDEGFVPRGLRPWRNGTKVSMSYLRGKLKERLSGHRRVHPESELRILGTNYETGKGFWLTPDPDDEGDLIDALVATAFLPCSEQGYVNYKGTPCTDGVLASPLPWREALALNPKYLLVLMPRPDKASWVAEALEWAVIKLGKVKHPPPLLEAWFSREQRFQEDLQALRQLLKVPLGPERQTAICIAWPPQSSVIHVVEQRRQHVSRSLEVSRQAWLAALRAVM